MNNKWVTIDQAATILGVSAMTVRRRIEKGDLESKLENRRRLVCITDDTQVSYKDEQIVAQLRRENEQLRKQTDIQNEQIRELREELKQKDSDLRKERSAAEDTSQRHDTIVLQLTRQLEQSQRLLEYNQAPWWRKWFRKNQTTAK